ncbi:MAG: DsbA family protein [Stenotrophomonas maltophilia]
MSGKALVTVWFDYTCPHCHIGLGRLDTLSGEMALAIDRRPYLLRPDAPLNTVLVQERPAQAQSPTQESPGRRPPLAPPGEKPAAEPFSSRSLSTVLVHEATAFAREQGRDWEFYLEAAGEYWERGSDLGSIYTLRRSASKAGLDWETMWHKLESGHYRPWVLEEHRVAVEQGVMGVPSYLIGGKMYTGNVGLDALRRAVEGAAG